MLICSIQAHFQRSLQFSHVELPQLVFTNNAWFPQKKHSLNLNSTGSMRGIGVGVGWGVVLIQWFIHVLTAEWIFPFPFLCYTDSNLTDLRQAWDVYLLWWGVLLKNSLNEKLAQLKPRFHLGTQIHKKWFAWCHSYTTRGFINILDVTNICIDKTVPSTSLASSQMPVESPDCLLLCLHAPKSEIGV